MRRQHWLSVVGIAWGLILSFIALEGRELSTPYGTVEVEEELIWELIASPAMERLKEVRQYGVCYYGMHRELYDRFQHSVGVFALLKEQGASLEEQVAGLLHDASHTAFSHWADFYFETGVLGDAYQDHIHSWYLEQSGLGAILERYGLTIEEVSPKLGSFSLLEQELPDLCADRLDYNLQGMWRRGWITQELFEKDARSWRYVEGEWVTSNREAAKRLGVFSLFMTEHCWGAPENRFLNEWLGEAVDRGVDLGLFHPEEIFWSEDQRVWERLLESEDPMIQQRLSWITHPRDHLLALPFYGEGRHVVGKFRGVDPWVEEKGVKRRLTEIDPLYRKEFDRVKKRMHRGWSVFFQETTDELKVVHP